MGVAVGDAMGMPSSMLDPDRIRELFPEGIHGFLPAPPNHPIHDGMVAGQCTDDTQQTLVIADSILEAGKVDPELIARKLLQWAESFDAFSSLLLGPSSMRALQAFQSGASIERTGAHGDTNGASMRIAPVGIINLGDVNRTVRDVALACKPTHNTNIAIAGASGIACALGACVRGERSLEKIISIAFEGVTQGMKLGNPWLGASIVRRTELALDIVRRPTSETRLLRDLYDVVGASTSTTETVPASLALFYYSKGDPVRTAQLAARMGGDADTIGAIAGSIAGAYAGIPAFPQSMRETIERVNHFRLDLYAVRLAEFALHYVERSNECQ
jgi:ADP-ribosylglycohydrolase